MEEFKKNLDLLSKDILEEMIDTKSEAVPIPSMVLYIVCHKIIDRVFPFGDDVKPTDIFKLDFKAYEVRIIRQALFEYAKIYNYRKDEDMIKHCVEMKEKIDRYDVDISYLIDGFMFNYFDEVEY